MIQHFTLLAACGIAIGFAHASQAQDLVGRNTVTVAPGSDVLMAVPFVSDAEAELEVASGGASSPNIAVNGGTTATNFTADFGSGDVYYVRFLDGEAEGLWSTIITDNGTDLELADTRLFSAGSGGIAAGDRFEVYQHLTINDVFPADFLGQMIDNGDTIIFFENDATSTTNPAPLTPNATFFGTWANGPAIGADTTSGRGGNTILEPGTKFIYRHSALSSFTAELVVVGDVLQAPVAYQIPDEGDLNIGTNLPLPIALKDTNLGVLGASLIFPNNSGTGGVNPAPLSPNATFFGSWNNGPNGLGGDELLQPGQSFRLRVPASSTDGQIVSIPNRFDN